ncbi:MAG: hypothetical protein E7199_11140 [Schwartzia succinivorans]|nr:hypothetical protein [Schwartzia succinivorans]
MDVQELPMKDFLAHLHRHPIPEIMDEECLADFESVKAQYGDTITHGAGLEVRLGEEARYVDYIMNIDETVIPDMESLWYEIDYAEFRKARETGEKISPCLFANIKFAHQDAAAWDAFLPPFLGDDRAKKLRAPLERVMENLPKGANFKQIGTMTSRGELDVMRLVIMFPGWETIPDGLAAIGWQGDTAALREALAPWRETEKIAVNIDLGENGVLPKIGVEVFSRWRHPLLVDMFITRLEEAGLCLSSKAEALRRWIRIRPDGDPFIQTLIAYFKLNYRDGKIAEAKAYLEQSPYVHHHYFDAYERPVYVDFMVKNGKDSLPVGEALNRLGECGKERIRRVRFLGDVAEYEHLDRLLAECKSGGLSATVVLPAESIPDSRLGEIFALDAEAYIAELGEDGEPTETIRALLRAGLSDRTAARWIMTRENAEKLSEVVQGLAPFALRELIVSGGTPGRDCPLREQMEGAAQFINAYSKPGEEEENGGGKMKLKMESCFSPLRAMIGGEDAKQNANRGVGRGCGAGRDHFCVRPDGSFVPCADYGKAESYGSIMEYWERSSVLNTLRDVQSLDCQKCAYARRCLPCPAMEVPCPIQKGK